MLSSYKGRFVLILTFCFFAVLLASCSEPKDPAIEQLEAFIGTLDIDKNRADWKTNLSKPPQISFEANKKYYWDLQTNQGNMAIELMPQAAPMHVSSTLFLTHLGFYDDIIFHRVIDGFMAQGGDPLGIGSGGPGYEYGGEFEAQVKHDKAGILSMANRGPNTDGSQFFITFRATPHLNGRHTVFGQLVAGMDVLKKIEQLGTRSGRTKEEIKIIKASIRIEG